MVSTLESAVGDYEFVSPMGLVRTKNLDDLSLTFYQPAGDALREHIETMRSGARQVIQEDAAILRYIQDQFAVLEPEKHPHMKLPESFYDSIAKKLGIDMSDENKRREFYQKMDTYKDFIPQANNSTEIFRTRDNTDAELERLGMLEGRLSIQGKDHHDMLALQTPAGYVTDFNKFLDALENGLDPNNPHFKVIFRMDVIEAERRALQAAALQTPGFNDNRQTAYTAAAPRPASEDQHDPNNPKNRNLFGIPGLKL